MPHRRILGSGCAAVPAYVVYAWLLAFNFGAASGYQQNIVHASFDHIGRPGLSAPLQVKCAGGGDRIHILDLYYKINVCRAVEFRQADAASERNLRLTEQCTGKRLCLIREYDVTSPFLESKQGCLIGGGTQADEMYLLYKCVPPDKVRSICSAFEALDAEGYLATSSYPLPINSSEGKNPCVCDLRAVDASGGNSNGRVHLSFAEIDLGSDISHVDPASCQMAESRQYVQIQYSYGMSSAYELCKHRYNYDVAPSQVFKVIFSSPISRESGKLWMLYKVIGERQDILVKVKCYSLHKYDAAAAADKLRRKALTVGANESPASEDEQEVKKSGFGGMLLPLIIAMAVLLLLIIGVAVIIVGVRQRRCFGKKAMHRSKKRNLHQQHEGGIPEVCDDDDQRHGCCEPAADTGRSCKTTENMLPKITEPPRSQQPPASLLDSRVADPEMDVKTFRPFDTAVYTKLNKKLRDPSEQTPLMSRQFYVTLPRKVTISDNEEDEALADHSLPVAGASRQKSRRDQIEMAPNDLESCRPSRPASR